MVAAGFSLRLRRLESLCHQPLMNLRLPHKASQKEQGLKARTFPARQSPIFFAVKDVFPP